ncbi:MAG: M20/M25/M40 family metallo-hydrolase [Deltaproteobacteria bacterium]|nr:M20/M25/M40 family metallo-hydrolase [Deltaproteobacteria bacterium]
MRSLRIACAVLAAFAGSSLAAADPAADRDEASQLLAELVAIDTTQAGSTGPAVDRIASYLRAAGFRDEELLVLGPRPDRMNLVVRLPSARRAQAKPIVFMAHLDVVEANAREWSTPPFTLTERDGFYYGRGAVDIKNEVADLVANFARLRREGFVPKRDLLLALTADEEEGDANGVAWLLANRPDLMDVAYAINLDAGGLHQQRGRFVRMPIQTAEKLYLLFRIEATSLGGHGSLPTRENAIYRLGAALARLDGIEFPARITATTRPYLEQLAESETGELGAALRGVLAEPPDAAGLAKLSAIPFYNGTLRSVCTPTLIAGGHAENALPERATATLQCRLMPEDDPAEIERRIVERIADPLVRVTRGGGELVVAPASEPNPRLFAHVAAVSREFWPGVPAVPLMDPWMSDAAYTRRAGIPTYGMSGMYFDIDDYRAHGKDERIAVEAFEQGLEFTRRLLLRLGRDAR